MKTLRALVFGLVCAIGLTGLASAQDCCPKGGTCGPVCDCPAGCPCGTSVTAAVSVDVGHTHVYASVRRTPVRNTIRFFRDRKPVRSLLRRVASRVCC